MKIKYASFQTGDWFLFAGFLIWIVVLFSQKSWLLSTMFAVAFGLIQFLVIGYQNHQIELYRILINKDGVK